MVGSVTARMVGDVLSIGRLAVVPDMQGRGIGTRLLEAVEARSDAAEATLFTGALSVANLRLYQRLGYVETHRVTLPAVELVYLRKQLRLGPTRPGGAVLRRRRMPRPRPRGASGRGIRDSSR